MSEAMTKTAGGKKNGGIRCWSTDTRNGPVARSSQQFFSDHASGSMTRGTRARLRPSPMQGGICERRRDRAASAETSARVRPNTAAIARTNGVSSALEITVRQCVSANSEPPAWRSL